MNVPLYSGFKARHEGQAKKTSLLNLPPELRWIIFKFVFASPPDPSNFINQLTLHHDYKDTKYIPRGGVALLLTCRAIHRECKSLLPLSTCFHGPVRVIFKQDRRLCTWHSPFVKKDSKISHYSEHVRHYFRSV